jgi:hypothetical protein
MRQRTKELTKIQRERLKRYKAFWLHYCKTQDVVQAYYLAGYTAKTDTIARSNAYHLLHKIDKKLKFGTILDSAGLTNRYIANNLKQVIDTDKLDTKVKGLNLLTRCKGLQQSNEVNVGVQIVLKSQQGSGSANVIDVSAGSKGHDNTVQYDQITE